MPKTYSLAPKDITDLLDDVIAEYHDRLVEADVKIGTLLVFGPRDDDGQLTGFAITGHAGAQAAAQIKAVPLKDRVTKDYDVELLIDGDNWDKRPMAEKRALLDHECTHIQLTGETDDLGRPKVKMRDEDFIAWGFWSCIQRHVTAALEHRALKAIEEKHGQLMLDIGGPVAAGDRE